MKKVQLFYFEACPYCQAAQRYIAELCRERPELARVEIERIDEKKRPDVAEQYDYWHVPTFYVEGVKVHEGACDKATVARVLESAL